MKKLIDVNQEMKVILGVEAVKKGFDGLKAYIEWILKEKVKELKNESNSNIGAQ